MRRRRKEYRAMQHSILGSSRKSYHYAYDQNCRATKKEIRQYLYPIIFDVDTKKILYKSMALLALSKSLAIASPYFLKITVNALAEASKMDFNLAVLGILGFGATRLFSTLFHELRMNQIT